MATVVLRPVSVARTPTATVRSRQATTAALMELAPLPMSVATRVIASRLVASAVLMVHTVGREKSAAATNAQTRPIYAALTGQRATRGTYVSGIRNTTGTSAVRIPLAQHM